MAKIYKNAHISPEEIFLNQDVLNEQIITDAPIAVSALGAEELEQVKKEYYEQGYIAGKLEERTLLEDQNTQQKKQMEELLATLPQAIAQNRLDLHHEIAEIVTLITQQLFIENANHPDVLSQQIQHILSQLNNRQTVELYLHPQDITALQNGQIRLDANHLNGLKIKADESLSLGGCRVKTSHGAFDASIEKQIDKLKEALLQIRQRGQDASMD